MINYDFKQIVYGLIAFISNIEGKLKDFIPDIPVFVLQTGDNSYIMDSKFKECDANKYEKVPRFVITFTNVDHADDTDTNIRNSFEYIYTDKNNKKSLQTTIARRLELDITAKCTMVSSNFITGLEHLSMLLSIFRRENVFTYEFAGSTFDGGYSCDNITEITFPEMESGTRNFIQNLDVKIQLHIYIPRIERIETYKESKIKYEIASNGENVETKTV